MKLKVTFKKVGKKIEAMIQCINSGDYPTITIFAPTAYCLIRKEHITLNQAPEDSHHWSHVFPNSDEALACVKSIIAEIKKNLIEIRDIEIPEDMIVEI